MSSLFEENFNELKKKIESTGELPVFKASVHRLRSVGKDPDSDAMSLAMEAMKDANLSTRLLRLANSPYYNRCGDNIGSISRAVVVLGFDTVLSLSLTLKLVETFQSEHPDVNLQSMLVSAFLSAGMVRDIAMKCGVQDIEETYVCALLHNLGQIVVGFYMPEKLQQIRYLHEKEDVSWEKSQQDVLGGTYQRFGQAVAQAWQFPGRVISAMKRVQPGQKIQIANQRDLNMAMASLANDIIGSVYQLDRDGSVSMRRLTGSLAEVTGLKPQKLKEFISDSFRNACDVAEDFGLNSNDFIPKLSQNGDEELNEMVRQFSFYARSTSKGKVLGDESRDDKAKTGKQVIAEESAGEGQDNQENVAAADGQGRIALQLKYFHDISTLIINHEGVHKVFGKVVEALHRAVGFERVALCLLNSDHSRLSGRIVTGADSEELKALLDIPMSQANVFVEATREGVDMHIDNAEELSWRDRLPAGFVETAGVKSFVLAGMMSTKRSVGMFYADKGKGGGPMSEQEEKEFSQFVNQARIALQLV